MPFRRTSYTNILFATLACAPLSAFAQNGAAQSASSGGDAAFVQQAAKGGMAEVELSKIASTSASSPDVRRFADHMVTDHTKNNQELATIAAHENIAVPKELDGEHARLRDELSTMKGPDLDLAYITAMRNDHQKMADLLKTSQATVSTDEMRTFIKTTLPVVQDHLRMAQQINVH